MRLERGVLVMLVVVMFSCKKEEMEVPLNSEPTAEEENILNKYLNLPEEPFQYIGNAYPSYGEIDQLVQQDNQPVNNKLTNEGATLGRVLFYDKQLSANNTISCASCHIQKFGFSDTAGLSKGFNGGETKVHSMGLSHARFREAGKYFWNERANSLEEQVLMPIQDEVEMGMTLPVLEDKLNGLEYYPILFKEAFGSSEVTSDKISKALAQFVRSISTYNSKYDRGRDQHRAEEDFSNFSAEENYGKRLFNSVDKGNCGGCHFTDAMVLDVARNNGLTGKEFPDMGLAEVTGDPMDQGKFRSPSLRNIAVRPPYMHDGSIQSLEEVVKAYSTQIKYSATLDAHLVQPGQKQAVRFNLTQDEINALVAFMKTLTDEEMLTDERFSDPFK